MVPLVGIAIFPLQHSISGYKFDRPFYKINEDAICFHLLITQLSQLSGRVPVLGLIQSLPPVYQNALKEYAAADNVSYPQ